MGRETQVSLYPMNLDENSSVVARRSLEPLIFQKVSLVLRDGVCVLVAKNLLAVSLRSPCACLCFALVVSQSDCE